MENKKRAFAYIRVSHEYQAATGSSADNQLERMQAYATFNNLDIVETFSDNAVSGRTMDRPSFSAMMKKLVNKEAEAVIVYSLSRFGRNTREVLEHINRFKDMGVTFYCVDLNVSTEKSSAFGTFMIQMLAALSEFESNQTSDRIKSTLRGRKMRGKTYCANPPLGLDNKDGVLVVNEKEMEIVKFILSYDGSLSSAANILNRRGEKGKNGGIFAAETIKKIKNNESFYLQYIEDRDNGGQGKGS